MQTWKADIPISLSSSTESTYATEYNKYTSIVFVTPSEEAYRMPKNTSVRDFTRRLLSTITIENNETFYLQDKNEIIISPEVIEHQKNNSSDFTVYIVVEKLEEF
jgi:hypothetical protein